MRGCDVCEAQGDRPHATKALVSEACPRALEARRLADRARAARYRPTTKGRAAGRRYSRSVKGILRSVRHEAKRRGAK